ncbi:girdin [Cylas formicarius]|uniref:girdin n=1 Tax=Cylas formicarius TaxID=197179 RepID=UPI0029584E05|nr:girdin [Cylas formicarius]
MAVSACEVEDFLKGPLVKWLSTCVKNPSSLQVYEAFFDGSVISEVLLQIDPEPVLPVPTLGLVQHSTVDTERIKIFHSIIRSIKTIYEEELGQIVVKLPDCIVLGKSPTSKDALSHLKLVLLLLLGCAVQGPTKEIFITRIKDLDVDSQKDIVECIKQVTDEQSVVLTLDWSEHPRQKLFALIRTLIDERDKLLQERVIDLGQEKNSSAGIGQLKPNNDGVESNHWAVELADWKAKLRKHKQELEEKNEMLSECKEELEYTNSIVAKLKTENKELLSEMRKSKAYQDEVDSIRDRAERTDRLEMEVQRYREKLADAEYYKTRVEELREDNRVLLETREMLEAQLARARQRADLVLELEAELLSCKQKYNEIMLERDAANEKILELVEENEQLQQVTKSALQKNSLDSTIPDFDLDESTVGDNSLSEQLTNNAEARALRLELENRKLLSKIESLKEDNFRDNVNKILELDKERKKLFLKCEQLQENCDKLKLQNSELETLFKSAIQENKKLQNNFDNLKTTSDRQAQELQNEKFKISDLEKTIENLSKEKQRVQILCDSVKKRADDTDKSLNQASEQLQNLKNEIGNGKKAEKMANELKLYVETLEKENAAFQKEIVKLKQAVELKDVALDTKTQEKETYERELVKLNQEILNVTLQLEKLQACEQKANELVSQASIQSETISTLQKNLINEKVCNEKLKSNIEKLGLSLDVFDNDLNVFVEKILNNSEIFKQIESLVQEKVVKQSPCKTCHLDGDALKHAEEVAKSVSAEWSLQCDKLYSDIGSLQNLNDTLQNENATLQVDISTLKSQIHSLQAQQCALQLANSQLVAEKEELSKKQQLQNTEHNTLLLDQVTLRTLHEQLTSEYEELKIEQETLKKLNRDLKLEIRDLKEGNDNLRIKVTNWEIEKESLKKDTRNLTNLRTEHSKLKDDFRNLFTASERLKLEYRNVQEELKTLRTESRNLRLGRTEMQGELNSTSDKMASLQMENARLQQKCDMLFEMNHSLDSDRRALMDHISQLLSQYHSLLTHSLEDKQHYHLEEKLFTDKMNNLCRQKEKLEEKIMEHYRKLDNASSKKKGFGAIFVKRVRKAGSDIINKVPNRNRRSWHVESSSLSQSQLLRSNESGESAGNESDNSMEDPLTAESFKRNTSETGSLHGPKDEIDVRKSYKDLANHRSNIAVDDASINSKEPGSALSLGSVGSRRTVYLAEDDVAPVAVPKPAANIPPTPSNGPLLVYNRISTVIGEPHIAAQSSPIPQRGKTPEQAETSLPDVAKDEKRKDNPKETAVWYEYGCV